MRTVSLPLVRIKLEQNAQPRVELDDAYTEEIVSDLLTDSLFPPIVVYYDGDDYWLADGFHRYRAHQRAGRSVINAEVRKGGVREAILCSVGANSTHGKRRSNADKRKAVLTLFEDPIWGTWTDRAIAKYCRVSQPFVSSIRKELTDKGYQFPVKRICSNGREMDVSQIGSNRGQDAEQMQASVGETSESIQQEENTIEGQPETDETPPEDQTGQLDVSEPAGQVQSDTPETSDSGDGNEFEDTAPTVEAESEFNADENEAIEAVSEVVSPVEDQMVPPQEPDTAVPQIDEDIPTLKAKIADLKGALQARDLEIQEKDRIIEGLEAKIWKLEADLAYSEKEIKAYEKDELARECANKGRLMFSGATF